MTIVFKLFYGQFEENFGHNDGGTSSGNYLLAPIVQLRTRLEQLGHAVYSSQEHDLRSADVVVFLDVDERMFQIARCLPKRIRKVLVCIESPIAAPFAHQPRVMFDEIWYRVMTFNRAYESGNVLHYDIPISNKVADYPSAMTPSDELGVIVCTAKRSDRRGTAMKRDRLANTLARINLIHVYGHGWVPSVNIRGPTSNKIATMRHYRYTLAIENSIYAGYVTEKLPDSILAGIPALYYGDVDTASRRFPGTFVPLTELSVAAFRKAKQELDENYEILRRNVLECQSSSSEWSSSFIDSLLSIIDNGLE